VISLSVFIPGVSLDVEAVMHTKEMKDSEGVFSDFKWSSCACRYCKHEGGVRYRIWESNCGGYEDLKYECMLCGGMWWVEGSDS